MRGLKKLLLLSLLLLLVLSLVSAQSPTTTSATSSESDFGLFNQLVVKEHFLTKKEIKDHMNDKSIEYFQFTETAIIKSFEELENVIDKKINKFIFKLVVAISGLVFFLNSLFYYLKKRFDRRLTSINSLKEYQKTAVDQAIKDAEKEEKSSSEFIPPKPPTKSIENKI